jgi:hypothetical protein
MFALLTSPVLDERIGSVVLPDFLSSVSRKPSVKTLGYSFELALSLGSL